MILVILFLFGGSNILCFNLDTNFPVVYTDPFSSLSKSGDRSNYFGYSVILHGGNAQEDAWIQIGAPRANSTNSKIHKREPGVIIRCKIFGPCTSVDIDQSTTDGGWLGGTMDIDETSERSVVCSYRWFTKKLEDYWMLGACYWSAINGTTAHQLMPLADNRRGEVDMGTMLKKRVYYYAQGQAGFAAHFSTVNNDSELLLGAPGVYNWNGASVIYRDGLNSGNRQSSCLPNSPSAAHSTYNIANIGNSMTTSDRTPLGLFGYSLTSGCFFKKNELFYVSGAPRYEIGAGKILIFKFANACDRALEIRETQIGSQLGEYFGAALAAGDINDDGLDDLIIGAPFYTNSNYNEGRIFVLLGNIQGILEVPETNSIIYGNAVGGQFGTCIMFLGDLHQDGYSDIAVSAPYEDDNSGAVYIYRGNKFGLDSTPCQKLVGKSFVPNIQGFGISMSKPADIDSNAYKDLAIGAYSSGHVVVLRSKPVVILQQSIVSLTPRLQHNAKMFGIHVCFWYLGSNVPPLINVTRKIIVDKELRRTHLPDLTLPEQDIILQRDNIVCQNITIFIKKNNTNYYDPITVSVSQEVVSSIATPEVIYIGENKNNQKDKFCKNCPVTNLYKSTKEQRLELSFALACGDDNLCISQLDLAAKFLNIEADNRYTLGSSDVLTLVTTISNSGEKAYLLQLMVELPKSVQFRSVPTNCLEQNISSIVMCSFENPLDENKQKTISLDLDMKGVNCEQYIDTLNFTLTVLTSSQNLNNNVYTMTLNTVHEADIALSGMSSQQSYSYGSVQGSKPNFTQVFEVEKFGASSVGEVFLTIRIPTQIQGIKLTNFVYLYSPEGTHADQPINCQSDANYIIKDSIVTTQFSLEDSTEENVTPQYSQLLKRSVRQVDQNISKQENASLANEIVNEYPANRTYYINCSNSAVICSYVSCSIGPFKMKQNLAVLQIKMLFDVSSLSKWMGNKDIVILSTDGTVTIRSPPNFIQSGTRSDMVRVSSVFVGNTPEVKIKVSFFMESLSASIVIGLLLVLILIMVLRKVGFFRRTKKVELEELKKEMQSGEMAEVYKRELVDLNLLLITSL